MIAFTSWEFKLSYQAVFLHDQKFRTKIKISQERKELLRWNKKNFSSFLKEFQLLEMSQTWDCAFNWNRISCNLHPLVFTLDKISLWKPLRYKTITFEIVELWLLSDIKIKHCVTSVQIRSFFWSTFSLIRTEYGDLQSINQDANLCCSVNRKPIWQARKSSL